MSLEVDTIEKCIDNLLRNIDPKWKIINVHSYSNCFVSPQSSKYDSVAFNRKVWFGKSLFESSLKFCIYEEAFLNKSLSEMKKHFAAFSHFTTTSKVLEDLGLSSLIDFGDIGNNVYKIEMNTIHVQASVFHAVICSIYEDSVSVRSSLEKDFKCLVKWILTQILKKEEVLNAFQKLNIRLFSSLDDSSFQNILLVYFQKKFQRPPTITTVQIATSCFEVTVYHHNEKSIGYAENTSEALAMEEACLKACKYLHLISKFL